MTSDSQKPSKTASSSGGSRRQGRESALQALYLRDAAKEAASQFPSDAWAEKPLESKTRAFAAHLVEGVEQSREEIDPVLKKYVENWELGRMATIDRCILRMATFELLYDVQTPVNVIINEAVEIAKKFSTDQSGRFVNGILDKVKQERKSL